MRSCLNRRGLVSVTRGHNHAHIHDSVSRKWAPRDSCGLHLCFSGLKASSRNRPREIPSRSLNLEELLPGASQRARRASVPRPPSRLRRLRSGWNLRRGLRRCFDGARRNGADLLFKKPWTLSPKMEFMLGIGPEWIHTNAYGRKINYDYKFGPGHEHSLGISGEILIAIPPTIYVKGAWHGTSMHYCPLTHSLQESPSLLR